MNWLYTGQLSSKSNAAKPDEPHLVHLYVLGEKLLDTNFQDRVIDAIVAAARQPDESGHRQIPDEVSVNYIYQNSPKGSPARKLMVDIWLTDSGDDWLEDVHPDKMDHDFMFDIAAATLANSRVRKELHNDRQTLKSGVPYGYYKSAADKPPKEGSE